MDKKIDEVLATLKSNYDSMQNVLKLERLDLDRRLKEAYKSDEPYDYEEISKLCYKIAKHIEVKESFKYSINVLRFKLNKNEGIK